jgi:hypothetical protein
MISHLIKLIEVRLRSKKDDTPYRLSLQVHGLSTKHGSYKDMSRDERTLRRGTIFGTLLQQQGWDVIGESPNNTPAHEKFFFENPSFPDKFLSISIDNAVDSVEWAIADKPSKTFDATGKDQYSYMRWYHHNKPKIQ